MTATSSPTATTQSLLLLSSSLVPSSTVIVEKVFVAILMPKPRVATGWQLAPEKQQRAVWMPTQTQMPVPRWECRHSLSMGRWGDFAENSDGEEVARGIATVIILRRQ
jgi:hypothetical protein